MQVKLINGYTHIYKINVAIINIVNNSNSNSVFVKCIVILDNNGNIHNVPSYIFNDICFNLPIDLEVKPNQQESLCLSKDNINSILNIANVVDIGIQDSNGNHNFVGSQTTQFVLSKL